MPVDCNCLAQDKIQVTLARYLTDDALQLVQDKVTNVKWNGVDEPADFEDLINDLADCLDTGGPKSLDLVSHSVRGDNFLILGEVWQIYLSADRVTATEDTFQAVRDKLLQIGVNKIRLLGCMTATSLRGIETMVRLEELFGGKVKVLGTSNYLDAEDFGPNGYIDNRRASKLMGIPEPGPKLAAAKLPGLPKLPITAKEVPELNLQRGIGFWLPDVVAAAGATWPRRIIDRKFDDMIVKLASSVSGSGRAMPGMLVRPSREFLFPVPRDVNRVWRVQFLFEDEMVRVYTRDVGENRTKPSARTACFLLDRAKIADVIDNLLENSIPLEAVHRRSRARVAQRKPCA